MPKKKDNPNDTKEYYRQYYIKNKDNIRAKRIVCKENLVTEEVLKWKADKLQNPYALYPFYEPDISIKGNPSSSST